MGAGVVDLFYDVQSGGVEQMLNRLDANLSGIALGKFLGVKVDQYIRLRAAGRFASEGDDVTGPWAPLADSTKDIRANQGFGPGPINRRTGELEDYVVGTGGLVAVMVGQAVYTGPGVPPSGKGLMEKVKTAQGGKSYPNTKARPVIGINEQDLFWVLAALSDHVSEGIL